MKLRVMKRVKMIASFAVLIILLVLVLELINWIPSIIDKESFRKYETIESVKKKLHIEKIYAPAYLPEDLNLRWPPEEIYAQKKPFAMVITHLRYRDSKDIGLIIQQVDAKAGHPPEPMIKLGAIMKENSITIKDREGKIISASCGKDITCNQVSWKEGDFLLTVIGKTSQRDVIRIAMSMIPES